MTHSLINARINFLLKHRLAINVTVELELKDIVESDFPTFRDLVAEAIEARKIWDRTRQALGSFDQLSDRLEKIPEPLCRQGMPETKAALKDRIKSRNAARLDRKIEKGIAKYVGKIPPYEA